MISFIDYRRAIGHLEDQQFQVSITGKQAKIGTPRVLNPLEKSQE